MVLPIATFWMAHASCVTTVCHIVCHMFDKHCHICAHMGALPHALLTHCTVCHVPCATETVTYRKYAQLENSYFVYIAHPHDEPPAAEIVILRIHAFSGQANHKIYKKFFRMPSPVWHGDCYIILYQANHGI